MILLLELLLILLLLLALLGSLLILSSRSAELLLLLPVVKLSTLLLLLLDGDMIWDEVGETDPGRADETGDEGTGDGPQSLLLVLCTTLLLLLDDVVGDGGVVGSGDDSGFVDEDVMMGGEEDETCRSTAPEDCTEVISFSTRYISKLCFLPLQAKRDSSFFGIQLHKCPTQLLGSHLGHKL